MHSVDEIDLERHADHLLSHRGRRVKQRNCCQTSPYMDFNFCRFHFAPKLAEAFFSGWWDLGKIQMGAGLTGLRTHDLQR